MTDGSTVRSITSRGVVGGGGTPPLSDLRLFTSARRSGCSSCLRFRSATRVSVRKPKGIIGIHRGHSDSEEFGLGAVLVAVELVDHWPGDSHFRCHYNSPDVRDMQKKHSLVFHSLTLAESTPLSSGLDYPRSHHRGLVAGRISSLV